jgi:hypothetical protein
MFFRYLMAVLGCSGADGVFGSRLLGEYLLVDIYFGEG